MLLKNIPILRIFDVAKAKEFYICWLGFTLEWEHQFEPDTPYYIGIKKDDIVVDCTVNRGGHAKEFAKKLGGKTSFVIF